MSVYIKGETDDLANALQTQIMSEYSAIQQYKELLQLTNDEKVRDIIMDIINEERQHAGEFTTLLHLISKEDSKHFVDGVDEVAEKI